MGSRARTTSGSDRNGTRTRSGHLALRGMRQGSPPERKENNDDDNVADDQDEIWEQDFEGEYTPDHETLEGLLRKVSVQHVDSARTRCFWPTQALERVLTRDRVVEELKTYANVDPRFSDERLREDLTKNILLDSRKIFAILVLIGQGPFINNIVQDNLRDIDLPLVARGPSHQLYRRGRKSPERSFTSGRWMTYQREIFSDLQYAVNPVILRMEADGHTPRHDVFSSKVVLPFIAESMRHDGGFGVVTKVKIHPDCHGFHNVLSSIKTNDSFAIKQLITRDVSDFQREVNALRRFNGFSHDHLVTLLATYSLNNRYHLIFPWANCDLEEYWERRPSPQMDTSTIRWMSKQLVGLTGALHTIHEPPSNSLITPQTNIYGRHGDLKPENILWYDSPSDVRGILVIADLGLSKLNSIRTRSNEAIEDLHATARYRPPECDIEGGKVSRAYDVWTFGCLLLEWLCWAMNGQADRVQFLYSLRSPYSIGAYSDVFFDLIAKESGGHQVIVKSKVIQLIRELQSDARCTQYFHDLLGLIEEDMIVLRSQERMESGQLHEKLCILDQRVLQDKQYCTETYSRSCFAKTQIPLHVTLKRQYPIKADGTVLRSVSDSRSPTVHNDDASGTQSSWVIDTPSTSSNGRDQDFVTVEVARNQSQNLHRPEEPTSNDNRGIGERFKTATSACSDSPSSESQHLLPLKSPVMFNASGDNILRSQENILTVDNSASIWAQLPTSLQNVIKFEQVTGGMPCWTCVPSKSCSMMEIPLTIAGAPVVIPAITQIPIRGGVAPPKDPFSEAISPCAPIPESTAGAIFKHFPAAVGFYLLVNGFLQLLVPSDFDLEDAYDSLPSRFGGLKVTYVQGDAYPRPTHNSQVTPMSNLAPIRIGSFAVAKPEVTRGQSKPKRAKIGVKTQFNGHTYVTVSTHLITKALHGNNMGVSLDTFQKVHFSSDDGLKIGAFYHTFDQDVLNLQDRPFPLGFDHDTSLVRVINETTTQDFRAPQDTDWLPKDEFIRLQYDATKICFLEDQTAGNVLGKNIPLGESGSLCSIVGQALFRAYQDKKKTKHPMRAMLHNLFAPKSAIDTYDAFVPFKTAVTRSLLYRVSPPFDESGGESGKAVCVEEPGSTKLKILGFQSFAQDVIPGCTQYYSEEGDKLLDGIKECRVAFYGAFPVPEEMINEHKICM